MIINQLVKFCTVDVFLFLFSFLSKSLTLGFLSSSLSLEMLLLLCLLLDFHPLNLLDEISLSLSIIDSLFGSLFFFG
jgi:hypothetical protein